MNQLGFSDDNKQSAAHRSVGLARYGSAPGSLLSSIADSVIGSAGGEISMVGTTEKMAGSFLSGETPSLNLETSFPATSALSPDMDPPMRSLRSYNGRLLPPEHGVCGEIAGGGSNLVRHSSSPAGFFAHLLVESDAAGHYPKGSGNLSQSGANGTPTSRNCRMSSQWSFSNQDSFSQISEASIDIGANVTHGSSTVVVSGNLGCPHIPGNLPLSSWDDAISIHFSALPNKRSRDNNGEMIDSFGNLETRPSLPCTSLEMEAVEKYLNMQQDPAHCKLRAKRGCATHPRSIAERERRTRISKRLRKLQELVPNMDKQTNTSDMLDLALQYIRELRSQLQKLKQEGSECRCGIK